MTMKKSRYSHPAKHTPEQVLPVKPMLSSAKRTPPAGSAKARAPG